MSATLRDGVTISPLIVAQKMAKGAVLMNTANGECFELNVVGAAVWEHLGQGAPLPVLVETIADHYGVDRETVAADVLRLIDDLARQGIVMLAAR
jgi:hypothetical protein